MRPFKEQVWFSCSNFNKPLKQVNVNSFIIQQNNARIAPVWYRFISSCWGNLMVISTICHCGRSKKFNCSTSWLHLKSCMCKRIYYFLKLNNPLQRAMHFYGNVTVAFVKKKKTFCFTNAFKGRGLQIELSMNIQMRLCPFKGRKKRSQWQKKILR